MATQPLEQLSPLQHDLVVHFGEMGSRWGITRTVGQIYGLLFVSPEPLNADQLVETLGFSRSNVSGGLKELQAWHLVRMRHLPGDRREYFSVPDDLWDSVRALVDERKKREIDPMLATLNQLLDGAAAQQDDPAFARVSELKELTELLTGWYDDINRLSNERIVRLLQLGATVQKILNMPERISGSLGRGRTTRDDAAPDTGTGESKLDGRGD